MSEIKRYDVWTSHLGIQHEDERDDGSYCLYSEVESLLKEKEEQLTKHRELMDRMATELEEYNRTNCATITGTKLLTDYQNLKK